MILYCDDFPTSFVQFLNVWAARWEEPAWTHRHTAGVYLHTHTSPLPPPTDTCTAHYLHIFQPEALYIHTVLKSSHIATRAFFGQGSWRSAGHSCVWTEVERALGEKGVHAGSALLIIYSKAMSRCCCLSGWMSFAINSFILSLLLLLVHKWKHTKSTVSCKQPKPSKS